MTLVSRYVFRECVAALIVVVGVLFLILMSNQLAQILGDAAGGYLPRDAIFSVLGLTSLRYLTLLAPIGLFLAVMLALSRLNRDSEMAALAACGVGPTRLLRPIGLLALLLTGAIAWLALVQTPAASARIEEIKIAAREALKVSLIEAGRFASPDSGDTIVYSREVSGDDMLGVFLVRQDDAHVEVTLADRGRSVRDAHGAPSFVLFDGTRYEGVPGEESFWITTFAEAGIPVRAEEDEDYEPPIATQPTADLMRSSDPAHVAELQWRLAAPLSLPVLALLAVPLSRSAPREGRYGRVGAALLIYILYANLLSVARVWVEREVVPVWVGMWWVHALALLIGLLMLIRQSGGFTSRQGRPVGANA